MAEPRALFEFRDAYEIGTEYHRGWVVVRPDDEGVRLSIMARGVGHDEPSMGCGHTLSLAEAAELRDVLNAIIPDATEPAQTPQWGPKKCDVCGESIRTSNDYWAGSYKTRRFGRVVERSGEWHGHCVPAEFHRSHPW